MLEKMTRYFRKEASQQKKQEVDRFSKWNRHAREVLMLAQKEAVRLKQEAIGCEHLLLGILSQEQSVALKALQLLEIDLVKTREALEQKMGAGQALSMQGITPNCKSAISFAVDEARHMKHSFIGSGHILLGIMRVKEDMAARFLEDLKVDTDRARVKVWELFHYPDPDQETLHDL